MRRLHCVVLICAVPCLGFLPLEATKPAGRPKLAVLVIFDQLRGDYIARWRELYAKDGGFSRLTTEGAWFTNCHYPYASTVTGAGHASLATGCTPDVHGIVENEWYDRKEGAAAYCATLPRYQRVPPLPATVKTNGSGSPERLLVPTLADAFKEATGGKGRIVALSLKDRGCVISGGQKPDAVYWYDDDDGLFVTSTFYRDRPHAWVAAYNERRPANAWFGKDWTRLRSDIDYGHFSSVDDAAGEGTGKAQGRTFPHPMTGGLDRPGKNYYGAIYTSPFGNDLLLDLTKCAVEAEQLGQRETPDLLLVSFSANDPVGHAWGPDSQEVLDTTLRTDLLLRDLLQFLDAKVGKGNYVLALSSDHGVCPLPEQSQAHGRDAGRHSTTLWEQADALLREKFGSGPSDKARWIEAVSGESLYLNQRLLKERGVTSEAAEQALAGWLKTQKGIHTAYTRTELLREELAGDVIGQRVRRSFHPERSGDVFPVMKPLYIYSAKYLTGTTHGSPHSYDTHVPLMVFGTGVRPGERSEAVTPLAAPVILGHVLGVKMPRSTEAVPAGLFDGP